MARFSSQCSWDESKRHFDITPEITSYALCGICETPVSPPPPLINPSVLEDFRKIPSSHLPTTNYFSCSFSKSDVNFLPLFKTVQNIDLNSITRTIKKIFSRTFYWLKNFSKLIWIVKINPLLN